MSTFRPTTEHDRVALKAAFRALVRAAGGQTAAAAATRVNQQRLSDYGRPEGEWFAPIDVVADLTMDADCPVVVQELCRLANGAFVPLPGRKARGVWGRQLADVVREGGEAAAAVCEALVDDGEVSAAEIRSGRIVQEISEAIEALCVLRQHCQDVLHGEGGE